ncbi:16S rRNA (adenine(1518)-N(6)/adenine(1519)-N(6))-dimethyltransferase RsmA [Bartonella sp. DGB1]|uniref:16S rRNA (adenine(1518)-N(6)/adenine(1519)-N(6))- dimethyltransferase RsmA n=1 Tax=Bartonella sp. DGB1 TaxID=3239807 RepID=UPI003525ACDF
MSKDLLPLLPLQQIIKKYNLIAEKSLGQNFLLDTNLINKITSQAGNIEGETIIEIGPGPGGLTRSILQKNPQHLIVIERDKRCIPILEEISAAYPNKLTIISADALTVNFEQLAQNCANKPKIIANLPYNIGTQLLVNWLLTSDCHAFYKDMTLMFQKEVAERITAKVNTEKYGRLSLLANWKTINKICLTLPPSAFTPPPKVNSAVVFLKPKENPIAVDAKIFDKIVKMAFGQKRKMLRQSLKSINANDILPKLNIDPQRRAETLTLEEFIAIIKAVSD